MIKQLLLFLLMLLPMPAMAQITDAGLDSLYMSYMSDDTKAQIKKQRELMAQVEQAEERRKEQQMWWYLILAGCAISAIIVTGGIFRSVFKGHADAPIHRKISAAAICLFGGIAIFLLDVGWFYMSIEASQKAQTLILFAILLAMGIALWIYTKNLKKENDL